MIKSPGRDRSRTKAGQGTVDAADSQNRATRTGLLGVAAGTDAPRSNRGPDYVILPAEHQVEEAARGAAVEVARARRDARVARQLDSAVGAACNVGDLHL